MQFSELLNSLSPHESGGSIHIGEDWLQGRTAFGGLIAAIGNEAMRQRVARELPLRSLQTTFVGPASGELHIEAHVLRAGKSVTIAQSTLRSGDATAATFIGIYGRARPSTLQRQPAIAVARSTAESTAINSSWANAPRFIEHFAVRLAQGALPFQGSVLAHSQGYVHHIDDGAFSEGHVIALADCLPTPALQLLHAPAPASTITWSLELLDHQFDFRMDDWWRIDTQVEFCGEGYVNQTATIVNPAERAAALSRMTFAVFG